MKAARKLSARVARADTSRADLAFAVHQALLKAELGNPGLAQHADWQAHRSHAFDHFLAEFELV